MPVNKKSAFSKSAADSGENFENVIKGDLEAVSTKSGEAYTPEPPADTSKVPSKIKIDISTDLENMWLGLCLLACFIALGVFNYAKFGTKHIPPNPALFKFLPIPLGAAAIFLICRFLTNNYYIMDTVKRKFFYHFKFAFNKKITELLDFDEVLAIGVNGSRKLQKNQCIWTYYIFIANKKGVITELSDHMDESKISELNDRARGMAAVVQCKFIEASRQRIVFINPAKPDNLSVTYNQFDDQYISGWLGFKNDFVKARQQWAGFDSALKSRIIVLLIIGAVLITSMIFILPALLKIN